MESPYTYFHQINDEAHLITVEIQKEILFIFLLNFKLSQKVKKARKINSCEIKYLIFIFLLFFCLKSSTVCAE
jgi:hypothetical protein